VMLALYQSGRGRANAGFAIGKRARLCYIEGR